MVVVSNTWVMAIGGYLILLTLYFFLTLMTTPAAKLLLAKLLGRRTGFVWTYDGQIRMITEKVKGGSVEHKQFGNLTVPPESVGYCPELKNSFFLIPEPYGVATTPRVFQFATALRNEGYKNLGEFEQELHNYKKEIEAELSGIGEEPENDAAKMRRAELLEQLEELRDISVEVEQGKAIKFADIVGFFRRNMNPSIMSGAIQRTVAAHLQEYRNPWPNLVFPFTMLIIAGALGWAIFNAVQTSQAPPVDYNALGEAIGSALQNGTK